MAERIAMVGAGYFAGYQLQGWRDAGEPVQALCDLDRTRCEALAERHGVPARYTQLAAMLDAVQPTLLDVVLPPQAQAAVLREAFARGIACICQKPFGADYAEAQSLAAEAAGCGLMLAIHENFRFMPGFRECRRLIDAGHFGRLHGIAFRLRPGDGQGPEAYLARQPYFQSLPRLLVRETAVHFIDCFRYLCGEVQAVTARLRRLNPAIAGEDAGLVVFEFDGGVHGLFDGNRLNGHPAQDPRRTMGELWLEGERGVLRLDGDARLWWLPQGGAETEHAYDRGPTDRVFGGAVDALQRHVLAHRRDGAPLENAAADYLANLRVQEAVYRSHDTGRRIEMAGFDPHQP